MSLLSLELKLSKVYLESCVENLSKFFINCYDSSSHFVGSLALQFVNGLLPKANFNSSPMKPQKRTADAVNLNSSRMSPPFPIPPKKLKTANLTSEPSSPPPRMFNELFNADGEKLFMCMHCSYSCSLKTSMTRHVGLKHDPNAKKFPCTMCPLQAKFSWQLKTHYVKVHNLSETAAKAVASEA